MTLQQVLMRSDGRPRGPVQLWSMARAMWLWSECLVDTPDPEAVVGQARAAMVLMDQAGAADRLRVPVRVILVAALRDEGRLDEAAEEARHLTASPSAPGAGPFWMANQYLGGWRPGLALPLAQEALNAARDADETGLVVDAAAVLAQAMLGERDREGASRIVTEGLAAWVELRPDHLRFEAEPSTSGLLWDAAAKVAAAASDARLDANRTAHAHAHPDARASLAHTLAWTLHERGQYDEAVQVLEAAQGERGDLGRVHRMLAHMLLAHQRRPADAKAALEAAVNEDRGTAREWAGALLELCDAACQVGDPARAVAAAREVLALQDATAIPEPWLPDWRTLFAPSRTPGEPVRVEQLVLADMWLSRGLAATAQPDAAIEAMKSALGRCRDACIQQGGDAVPVALEDQITTELRRLLGYGASPG